MASDGEKAVVGHYLVLRNDHPRSAGLEPAHFMDRKHREWWAKALTLDDFSPFDLGMSPWETTEYGGPESIVLASQMPRLVAGMKKAWAIERVKWAAANAVDDLKFDASRFDEVCATLLATVEEARSGFAAEGRTMAEIISEVADDWDEAVRSGVPQTLPMPIKAMQDALGGWQIGKVVMLGAKSSEHKTSFGRKACDTVAKAGHTAMYWLMEDEDSDLGQRAVAERVPQLDTRHLATGTVPKELRDNVGELYEQIKATADAEENRRIIVVDRRAPKLGTIGPEIGRLVAKYGVKFVVLDFAQLIVPDKGGKNGDWWAHLSAWLHTLAAHYGVAMLVLGQFETQAVRDMAETGRAPRITDMYGGDTWRQNAFGCICMWKTGPTRLNFRVDKWKSGANGLEIMNVPVDPAHDRIG